MPDQHPERQVSRGRRFFRAGFIVLVLAAAPLAGCGKKANQVDPPPGIQDEYPRFYPDPATDPKP